MRRKILANSSPVSDIAKNSLSEGLDGDKSDREETLESGPPFILDNSSGYLRFGCRHLASPHDFVQSVRLARECASVEV